MQSFLLSLLVSLLWASLASGAQVTLKGGLDCSAILVGCWFEDPTIWVNGTLPGPNDDVAIFSNSTTLGPIFLSSNTTFQVGSLSLYNSSFGVSGSAFSAGWIFVDSLSAISVAATSSLTVSTSLEAYGNVTLFSYGVLSNGDVQSSASFILHQLALLTAQDHSTLNWNADCALYGSLAADLTSSLYCENMTLAQSTPNVMSVLSASTLAVLPVYHVVIPNGFVGDFMEMVAPGMVTVYSQFSSQVQVTYPPPTLSSQVPAGPYARLELINITNAQITPKLYAQSGGIAGPVVLAITNSTANISCLNAEYTQYWLYSFVLNNATATVDNLWVSTATVQNSSNLLLGQALQVDLTVSVDPSSSFSLSRSSASFFGSLYNQGQLNLVDSLLNITGTYNQQSSGVLMVALTDDKTPSLTINGSATFSGSLQFTIGEALFFDKPETYLVSTYTSATGTFSGNAQPLSNSALKRALDIKYQTNQLTVEYRFKPNDIPFWLWIIVGGVAVVLLALIAFGIKCIIRRNSRYQEL